MVKPFSKAEIIGNRRVNRLKRMYEYHEDFFVVVHLYNNSGVDMLVFRVEKDRTILIEALEITNYAKPTFYINDEKFKRYINCLQEFAKLPNVQRTIYISYWENLSPEQHKVLAEKGIHVIAEGFQD